MYRSKQVVVRHTIIVSGYTLLLLVVFDQNAFADDLQKHKGEACGGATVVTAATKSGQPGIVFFFHGTKVWTFDLEKATILAVEAAKETFSEVLVDNTVDAAARFPLQTGNEDQPVDGLLLSGKVPYFYNRTTRRTKRPSNEEFEAYLTKWFRLDKGQVENEFSSLVTMSTFCEKTDSSARNWIIAVTAANKYITCSNDTNIACTNSDKKLVNPVGGATLKVFSKPLEALTIVKEETCGGPTKVLMIDDGHFYYVKDDEMIYEKSYGTIFECSSVFLTMLWVVLILVSIVVIIICCCCFLMLVGKHKVVF